MSAMDQTEKTADRVRTELLTTLKELDRRRLAATDLGTQMRQHVGAAVLAGSALAFGVGFVVAAARVRAKARRSILLSDRVHAFMRAWEHPGRVATKSKAKPLPQELGQKLLLIFATALASRLARQSAEKFLPLPDRRAVH